MQINSRLNKLIAQNRGGPRAYKFEAKADNSEATIYLYDIIGLDWWTGEGVTAKRFAQDVAQAKAGGAQTVHLRINSPGGDVFDARAIVTAIRESGVRMVAHVDGIAASAASYIATAADEVQIADGAFLMIHNAWTLALGDKNDMRAQADVLEKIDASIAAEYAKRATVPLEEVVAMMDAETWLTAQDAVDKGFADSVTAIDNSAGTNARTWNLSAYDKAPAAAGDVDPADPGQPARDYAAEHNERMRALQTAQL